MMQLVDTHCHIQSIGADNGEENTRQLWSKQTGLTTEQVIAEARAAGVNQMVVVGCTAEDSRLAQQLAVKNEGLSASIGIHPHEADNHLENRASVESFKKLIKLPKVVAVGECGLDYYYQHSPKKDQIKMLEMQLELALDNNLPLIFHVRDAFSDFWPVFNSFNSRQQPIRAVLHSYTDSLANMELAISHGLYLGVNGIATFAKQPQQIEVYRRIPLTNLVLETDSPFLTPTPIRGTINVPKNVGLIAAYLAEIKGEETETLANITTANAVKLFNLS